MAPQVAVNRGGYLVRVGHHNLKRLFLAQIAEIFQHILGGAVIQRGLVVGILKTVAGLQDRTVRRILRFLKMDIAGCNNRFVQLFTEGDNGAVELLDCLKRFDLAVAHHKLIVAERLDFQQVIVIGNAQQFIVAFACHNRPVKLAGFTGRGEDQPLAVLVEQAARHTRLFEEILGVRFTDNAGTGF